MLVRLVMSDVSYSSLSKVIEDHLAPTVPNLEPTDMLIGSVRYDVKRDELFTVPISFPEKAAFWINGFTLGESDRWIDFGPRMRKFVPSFDSKKEGEYLLAWDSFVPSDLNEDGTPKMSIRGYINKADGTILMTGHGYASIEVEVFIWGKYPDSE